MFLGPCLFDGSCSNQTITFYNGARISIKLPIKFRGSLPYRNTEIQKRKGSGEHVTYLADPRTKRLPPFFNSLVSLSPPPPTVGVPFGLDSPTIQRQIIFSSHSSNFHFLSKNKKAHTSPSVASDHCR